MALIDEFTLAEAISIEDCKAISGLDYTETLCGLRISGDLPIPGAYWSAIQAAHQAHHDARHTSEWVLLETVATNGVSVTSTFSCGCER